MEAPLVYGPLIERFDFGRKLYRRQRPKLKSALALPLRRLSMDHLSNGDPRPGSVQQSGYRPPCGSSGRRRRKHDRSREGLAAARPPLYHRHPRPGTRLRSITAKHPPGCGRTGEMRKSVEYAKAYDMFLRASQPLAAGQ